MTQLYAPKAKFEEVIRLINIGDVANAESLCRAAVEQNPRDINMLGLLGAVLIKMNRLEEAEKHLRRTIRLAPTFAKPHEDLGHLLLQTKQPHDAVKFLRKAIRLDPKQESAHFTLGKALAAIGEGKEADDAFETSFELNPQRKILANAVKHHKEGRLEEAEHLYRQVLRENPKNIDALRMLGVLAVNLKRTEEAENLFRQAISIAPDFTGAVLDLGQLLNEQDRFDEAIEYYKKVIELEPGNAKAYYFLGGALTHAGLSYHAVEAYQRSLEIRPKHPGALIGVAHSLKTIGQLEESIKSYRQCMELNPDHGEIHWSLANLKTYQFTDEDIKDMEFRITQDKLSVESKINFLFALAKAYDDRNEYEKAWHYYHDGNTTRRMEEQYDPVQTEVFNDTVINVFDKKLLKEKGSLGYSDSSPIFILGLPRSGSTLLEQIFSSHSMVEGTSELPYLHRIAMSLNRNRADGINYPGAVRELEEEHFKILGEDYIKYCQMHRTEGAQYFIDKMPNNFPTIGFLHLILPNAKIIDARRHPLDACVGCYRQLFARGQTFTYDLTDIGEYYLQYQRMMDHWNEVLPNRILTVQYEDVVTDIENQVRRILEYCELPWEDSCVKFYEIDRPVRTPSSEQVRQPIYTKAINHWRNYASHLGELIEILEPILDRYKQYESINNPDP